MSESNVEIARRAYDAFAAGDVEAAFRECAPDLEWIPPDRNPTAGKYRGVDQALAEIQAFMEPFAEYSYSAQEFTAVGDKVVVRGRHRARGTESGIVVEEPETHVVTFRQGKVVRVEMFRDEEEALRAAGVAD